MACVIVGQSASGTQWLLKCVCKRAPSPARTYTTAGCYSSSARISLHTSHCVNRITQEDAETMNNGFYQLNLQFSNLNLPASCSQAIACGALDAPQRSWCRKRLQRKDQFTRTQVHGGPALQTPAARQQEPAFWVTQPSAMPTLLRSPQRPTAGWQR